MTRRPARTLPAVARVIRMRPRAQGWTLRRRVGYSFVALAVLAAILLAAVFVSLAGVISKTDDLVNRWEPALVAGQSIVADVATQDAAVRGYTLSRGEVFLQRYRRAGADEAASADTLRSLLAGSRDLRTRLAGFERAAARWRTETAEPIIKRVTAGESGVAKAVDSPGNQRNLTTVQRAAASLTSDLDAASERAQHRRSVAATLLIVALVVAALALVPIGFITWRGLHRWVLTPVDRLAAQTREVAAGDVGRVISTRGPPELVNLGNDTDTMRAQMAAELERLEQARAALAEQGEELERSNADLEQFAYVASHDLSEPLRKVTNFCQLLERQYGGQLDDKAHQYIAFAVDGAKRMQVLINDLLAFSRVGRTTEAFVPVGTGAALAQALANLDEVVNAAGARVEHDEMPTVPGDEVLIVALLANLVSNAVKYRGEQAPRIHVGVRRDGADWEFTVRDNGIGIDPQYAERIFAIFGRLHLRSEYSGTGIGLALCRRIVEFHGGRIWLDSESAADDPRPGATFRFTLPAGDGWTNSEQAETR